MVLRRVPLLCIFIPTIALAANFQPKESPVDRPLSHGSFSDAGPSDPGHINGKDLSDSLIREPIVGNLAPIEIEGIGEAEYLLFEDQDQAKRVLTHELTTGDIDLGGTIAMNESNGIRGGALDSSQILHPHLVGIARRVQRVLKNEVVPLLTHGTDSLDATGMVLSQLFPDKSIVLTAAFHTFSSPGSDASQNLQDAHLVRRHLGSPEIPQVPYVVMNGKVHLAASLVELNTDYRNGNRGFHSFAGPVARIEGNSVIWDAEFLLNFEQDRWKDLIKSKSIRERVLKSLEWGSLVFGGAEIAYVNPFTPPAYIKSVLSRLENGLSGAVIFHGVFPSCEALLKSIKDLRGQGKPIYVQHVPGPESLSMPFPFGLSPFQLLHKLNFYLASIQDSNELDQLLRYNIAGEIAHRSEPSLAPTVALGNFYDSGNASRSFVLYHQDLPLMRASIAQEISRLKGEIAEGRRAELILEGLGNGHLHLDLRDLLAEASAVSIQVTITTRVKDARPDASYEVGRKLGLPDVGARFSTFPGRTYLSSLPE